MAGYKTMERYKTMTPYKTIARYQTNVMIRGHFIAILAVQGFVGGVASAQSPVASFSSASVTFGNQQVGTTSAVHPVTLTNKGTARLSISSIFVSGKDASEFAPQTNNCGNGLAINARCQINVKFTPAALGTRTASITFQDSASNSPQSVPLSGTGTGTPSVASLSTTSINFGNQSIATTSTARTVTLTNTGGSALSISSILVSGANIPDFTPLTNNCPSSLAINASCQINVKFTPAALGTRTASITIQDSASNSPQSVLLSGTGISSVQTGTFYVDGTTGSDLNTGTQSQPLRTISKAVSLAQTNNQKGLATTVVVNPGTYRESISMRLTSTSTSKPITLQAATNGTAIISGADVWTGWQVYAGNTQISTHAWPYQWGFCVDSALPPGYTLQPIALRREMIFVNGKQLTQVLALSQMREGTFYVNESNHTAYIWPASGTNVATSTIEVGVRPQLLTIYGETNLVFRGLTFRYANSCRGTPALSVSSSNNLLFDSDNIEWNNAAGLSAYGSNHLTIQNSKSNHNGEIGWTTYKVSYAQWNSDEGSYNNWRGAQAANYDLTANGGDFMFTHNSSYTGFKAVYNQAHGIHWDTDAVNVTVDSLLSAYNYQAGAVIEASQGPVTIQNSHICNSNITNKTGLGGLNLTGASYVTLNGNTFYNNLNGQIVVGGRPNGIGVTNFETGQLLQVYNEHLTATNNTVVATGGQQVFRDSYLTTGWSLFGSTLSSDSNTWWNANNANAFMVPVPVGSTTLNLAGWKRLTNRDANSTFTAPLTSPTTACAVVPDATDFWFMVDTGSQTVTRGNAASYIVSVVPLGFSGIVSLSVDATGVPATGASFSPVSINTSGSSTLTLTTSTATPPGAYPVTMIAHYGSITRTITVSLVVQ